MWPLDASGGWPLARGSLHSDSVNAQRMRAYMPGGGGVGEGGPYNRGTTVKKMTETELNIQPFAQVSCQDANDGPQSLVSSYTPQG